MQARICWISCYAIMSEFMCYNYINRCSQYQRQGTLSDDKLDLACFSWGLCRPDGFRWSTRVSSIKSWHSAVWPWMSDDDMEDGVCLPCHPHARTHERSQASSLNHAGLRLPTHLDCFVRGRRPVRGSYGSTCFSKQLFTRQDLESRTAAAHEPSFRAGW